MTSQRMVIAIATFEQLDLHQVDVNNAYLNGDIDAEMYMKQPQGFVDPRYPDTSTYVCALDKSLYGIKQAGFIWNSTIHKHISAAGFKRTHGDLCVYTKQREGTKIIVSLHVDDFLIAAKPSNIKWFTEMLQTKFSIKHQDATTALCLNLKIEKIPGNRGYMFGQQHYLEAVLQEFGMADAATKSTPLTQGEVQAMTADSTGAKPCSPEEHSLYRQIIGKLMYAMVGSRPDLAYSLSLLGRFAANPNTYHLAMARSLLKYVKHTISYKLHYIRGSAPAIELTGYVDSDWANDKERKSTTGFLFFLLHKCDSMGRVIAMALIEWCSKKQTTVATSTTVAEFIALYEATIESVSLRNILSEVGYPQAKATTIREDNQTALSLANDDASHKRTKHIDVKYYYTKEQREKGVIDITYVQSEENLADFFTKPPTHPGMQRANKASRR